MSSYKFKVGEIVTFRPAVSRNLPGGAYEVIRQLPETGGEREYRIKSANEAYGRLSVAERSVYQQTPG